MCLPAPAKACITESSIELLNFKLVVANEESEYPWLQCRAGTKTQSRVVSRVKHFKFGVRRASSYTKKLSEVDIKDYVAVFYVGGHGPVFDLAIDPVNIKHQVGLQCTFAIALYAIVTT